MTIHDKYGAQAHEIVESIFDELFGRGGLDIGEIVQDDEIEQEIICSAVERVEAILRKFFDEKA